MTALLDISDWWGLGYGASGWVAGVLLHRHLLSLGVCMRREARWFYPLLLGVLAAGWAVAVPLGRLEAVTLVLPLGALAVMDMRTLTVEPLLIACSLLARLGWLAFAETGAFLEGLQGALLGGGLLFLVGFFYRWLRGRVGLGEGDAAVLAAIGAHVGTSGILWVIFFSSGLALLVAPVWLLWNKQPLWASPLPFAPFLCAGGLLVRLGQLFGWSGQYLLA